MFKFEEICELIQLVGSSGVASVEVDHAGSRVRIEGRLQGATAPVPAAAPSYRRPNRLLGQRRPIHRLRPLSMTRKACM
jgi:hypothetical protein